jgi:hypothetical protein
LQSEKQAKRTVFTAVALPVESKGILLNQPNKLRQNRAHLRAGLKLVYCRPPGSVLKEMTT